MEVRSEQGVMSPREAFGVGLQKTLVTAQSPPPKMPNVQLTYTSDGTEVYKPVPGVSSPPYQGVAGSGLAAAAATVGASDGGDGHLTVIPQHGLNFSTGELPLKRKRGRPRKYGPEGTIALARTHLNSAVGGTPPPPAPFSLTSPSGLALTLPMRKVKGRPLGSGRKQQMDALGSGGIGFTPHVITVKAGEDVSAKIMSFCQHGPRAICILSANGAISNVTLRQTATSGGTVTYEGRFEILSITGSYMVSDNGGQNNRTGGLSVSLAGPDGRVLGGGVAGLLTAASPVQVVVGSFIADGRKDSKPAMKPSDHSSAPSKLASDGTTGPASPPSRGTPSESSDGPGSPLNPSTGAYNNSNQQGIYSNSNRQGTYSNRNQQGMSNIMWK